jgi:hypothetical protein
MSLESVEDRLDTVYTRFAAVPGVRGFTAVLRGLLAVGYFRAGLVKALGERFTTLSVETPIGHFFDAMYQTGFYYRFLGGCQVAASLLLLLPRTATLGALLYLPISLNIFLITVSVNFRGTPFITGPMLLGALYLVCWDYPRLKGVLFDPSPRSAGRAAVPQVPASLTLAVALVLQGLMGMVGGLTAGHFRPEFAPLVALGVGIQIYRMVRPSKGSTAAR